MTLATIVAALERHAPLHAAEPWDNVGLLIGDPAADVTRAMLCIDYTAAVAAEARAAGCELVVAYHPPLFKPITRLTADGPTAVLYDAARRGIAVYSPHTALDVAEGGTNDVLADILGLIDRRPLRPTEPMAALGIGRVGSFATPVARETLFDRVRAGTGVRHLLIAGPMSGSARTAAVCAGAGGELLTDAIAANADVYVTGELRHHDALRAAAAGMTVVCTLHSNSERVTLKHLAAKMMAKMPAVTWMISASDADPFVIL